MQQSVQLGFLFKQPASAFLPQLSCLSGHYSSDAVACKHNRLGLCLPAEQLNQQEIQSQSINWWNNFNHLRALSWRRKTLTNGVQLLHFLFACFRFVVFFHSCPLNSPLECNSEIWQPSRQPYAAKHGVFTSRSVWRPTWLEWLSINYYIAIRQRQLSDADK